MKRPLIISVTVILFIACITGIAIIIYQNIRTQQSSPNGPITLNVVGYKYTNLQMSSLIAEYEKLHPNIYINYTQISQNNYTDYLKSRFTSGNKGIAPDIFEAANTDEDFFFKYSAQAPSNIFSAATFKSTYFSLYDRGLLYKNQAVVGIPEDMQPLILIYNQDLMTSEGYTIQQFTSDFNSFNANETQMATTKNITSVNVGDPTRITVAGDILQLFMLENQTQMNDANGFYAAFNTTRGVQAVDYYKSFSGGDFSDNWSLNSSETDIAKFAKGEEVLLFAYPDEVEQIMALNPTMNLGYALYPSLVSPLTIAKYNYLGVYNKSQHATDAWQFIQYLSSAQSLQILNNELLNGQNSNLYGILFPRKDMQVVLQDQGLQTTLNQAAPIAVDWNTAGDTNTRNVFSTLITSVLNGEDASLALHAAQRAIDLNIQKSYYL